MKLDKTLIRQILLYGIIGGGSAFLDFILFALLYERFGINQYVANGISVHAGIILSFILNSKYNFKKTDKLLMRASSFYATGLFGLALSQGMLLLGAWMQMPATLVKFVSIFVVAAVQFVINKLITFRK
jgi:putative flippase GtrA